VIKLGERNDLTIARQTDNGFYLVDEDDHEVLIPNAYIHPDWKIGDLINVFVYRDSEDRLVATTLSPKIKLYGFALLNVMDTNAVGAFLDWGLPKDLFVPFNEQRNRMSAGKSYPVTLYIDYETDRLLASSKLEKFLEQEDLDGIEENQEVQLFVYKETDLGYKVIINNLYQGLLYKNEIFQSVEIGDELDGYVKKIREDNKGDVGVRKVGKVQKDADQTRIIRVLEENEGVLSLNDRSAPDEIYEELQMSKKAFKRAIGGLYKQRIIVIDKKGIRMK